MRNGAAAATATIALTRSGCSAAVRVLHQTLVQMPMSGACSMPSRSITAMMSPTNSTSAYAVGSRGRSLRPLPLGSIVTTRP